MATTHDASAGVKLAVTHHSRGGQDYTDVTNLTSGQYVLIIAALAESAGSWREAGNAERGDEVMALHDALTPRVPR